MKLLIDADAIPRPLKEALVKAAEREKVEAFFVAARTSRLLESKFVKAVAAGNGFNGADNWIVEHAAAGDLIVTADIPLADRGIGKGAAVLNTKGEFFTHSNIKNALAMRELMEELRITGEVTGGPPPFSERQRIRFIDALNRYLQKRKGSE